MHIDLYRLEPEEVEGLGLWEVLLGGSGVKIVEWSERLPFEVPGAVSLEIRVERPSLRRRLTIHAETAWPPEDPAAISGRPGRLEKPGGIR